MTAPRIVTPVEARANGHNDECSVFNYGSCDCSWNEVRALDARTHAEHHVVKIETTYLFECLDCGVTYDPDASSLAQRVVELEDQREAALKLLGDPADPYVHCHDGDAEDFMPDCAGCWSRDLARALGVQPEAAS